MKKYIMIALLSFMCAAQQSHAGRKSVSQLVYENGIDVAQATTIFCGAFGYSSRLTLDRPISRFVTPDVLKILSTLNLLRAAYHLYVNASR